MKSFNVTTITREGYPHSQALAEAAAYIHWGLIGAGYRSELSASHIDTTAHNIVFCAFVLKPEEAVAFPADTIIFNSEQLEHTDAWYLGGPYRTYLDTHYVWDYSLKNLRYLTHDRADVIPFLFCPDLVRQDMARAPEKDMQKDLLFYGATTERRKKILAGLGGAGVAVRGLFNTYGHARDQKMMRAWAVLNLRQFEQVTTFEPVRCFYPLTNGVPVISETADSDPTFAVYRDWIFAFDSSELVEKTAALYHDPARFQQEAADKLARFRATSGAAAIKQAVDKYLEKIG